MYDEGPEETTLSINYNNYISFMSPNAAWTWVIQTTIGMAEWTV